VAYEFKLPDLGEGLTEGEVARWLVSEGQEVAEDDPLVEIQTDKTTVEIPSPAAGRWRASSSRRGRWSRWGRCWWSSARTALL
jgi:pyruvate dehydrogenase E2 component (dihydrolipoamide acetyltransferase)